jgi:hypothetical protein
MAGQAVAGAQGEHAAVPLAKLPAGQVVEVKEQALAPCVLKVGAGQGRQAAAELKPTAAEYVPAAQGTQA